MLGEILLYITRNIIILVIFFLSKVCCLRFILNNICCEFFNVFVRFFDIINMVYIVVFIVRCIIFELCLLFGF